MEMCSDYVFKLLHSEETSAHITKQSHAKLRKRCELCPWRNLANAHCSIKSLTYTSPVVIGYVLAEFDMKNVQIDGSDVKQWILADNKTSKKKKIWCVKMLAWNEEARKFAT